MFMQQLEKYIGIFSINLITTQFITLLLEGKQYEMNN